MPTHCKNLLINFLYILYMYILYPTKKGDRVAANKLGNEIHEEYLHFQFFVISVAVNYKWVKIEEIITYHYDV